jgi:cytidylate kinase
MRIYKIDNDDYSFADMVINTDDISPQEVADLIMAELEKKANAD